MGSTDAIPIRVRITYFPVEGTWSWAAWRGNDSLYIDTTAHQYRQDAAAVAGLLYGFDAILLF